MTFSKEIVEIALLAQFGRALTFYFSFNHKMWLQKEASQWSWVQTPHKALDPPLTNKVESNNKVFNLIIKFLIL